MTLGGLEHEHDRGKRQKVPNLLEVLPADHILVLGFSCSKKKALNTIWCKLGEILSEGLQGKAECGRLKWLTTSKSESEALLPLRRLTEETNAESVLVGPPAEDTEKARHFRSFWDGSKKESCCQLRRFADGGIRESVALHNPWGPAYLPVAIVMHLVARSDLQVGAMPLIMDQDVLPAPFQTCSQVKRIRQTLHDLSAFLTSRADKDLPLRRVRGLGSAVHAGVDADSYIAPAAIAQGTVVEAKKGAMLLKRKATIAPSLVKAIPVSLDVTHKTSMGPELFSHLKMAYLLNIKKTMQAERIPSMIKDRKLYVIYKDLVFCLDVDPPKVPDEEGNLPASPTDRHGLQNYFQTVGLRHSCWAGAYHVMKNWLADKMLLSTPGILETAELLLAYVLEAPLAGLSEPSSCEAAFLRLLDLLSFHDFNSDCLFIDQDREAAQAQVKIAMQNQRQLLPSIVISTPFDGASSPSFFTKNLCALDARRLVNVAKQTLSGLVTSIGVHWGTLKYIRNDLAAYDVVIHLKPLQIPHSNGKRTHDGAGKVNVFPVVDYDPVASYLGELRECFNGLARFYYGGPDGPHTIGVKLEEDVIKQVGSESARHSKGRFLHMGKLVPNIDAMLEDFRVLGSGIIKDVSVQITSN